MLAVQLKQCLFEIFGSRVAKSRVNSGKWLFTALGNSQKTVGTIFYITKTESRFLHYRRQTDTYPDRAKTVSRKKLVIGTGILFLALDPASKP